MILLPEAFWQTVAATTEKATQSQALKPIPTEYEILESEGIPFLIRILTTLKEKEETKAQPQQQQNKGEDFDPFLPYEEDLFVADISETHICLLNKYKVVDNHLLIVTRDFEPQQSFINHADFTALAACLQKVDGLGFYNSGEAAGASVRHKHLQLVPRSLAPNVTELPIASILHTAQFVGNIGKIPSFPFIHGFQWLALDWNQSPETLASSLLQAYQSLMAALNCQTATPYNLLVTRNWMLLVPRKQEKFHSIGINSLGFAGALLVKNQQERQLLTHYQPLQVLAAVAQSPHSNDYQI